MPDSVCAIGDTHGHLQLVLCMAACWQRDNTGFKAVFLCGARRTASDLSERLVELPPKSLHSVW